MSIEADERVVSLLRRLSEASSVPEEVVLEQALKLWAAERELLVDAEAPQTEERSCAIILPLGSSEVWAYLPANDARFHFMHGNSLHVRQLTSCKQGN